MKAQKIMTGGLLVLMLGGCLEIEQHPRWISSQHGSSCEIKSEGESRKIYGEYDGKCDNMPHQVYYHNDRLAWNAVITNRNHLQNEYNRTTP